MYFLRQCSWFVSLWRNAAGCQQDVISNITNLTMTELEVCSRDIHVSEKQQKTWSVRRNLGYPLVMLLLLMLTVSAAICGTYCQFFFEHITYWFWSSYIDWWTGPKSFSLCSVVSCIFAFNFYVNVTFMFVRNMLSVPSCRHSNSILRHSDQIHVKLLFYSKWQKLLIYQF